MYLVMYGVQLFCMCDLQFGSYWHPWWNKTLLWFGIVPCAVMVYISLILTYISAALTACTVWTYSRSRM